jgi:hypothetical protein
MKAALALVFFACIAGSMASTARAGIFDQLLAQGEVLAQGIFAQLQQSVLGFIQQAVSQLSSLVGSIGGRFDFNFQAILDQFKPLLAQFANQALAQVLGGLQGIIGARAAFDISAIFNDFLASITPAITGLGQHFLNQGLAAVLGGLGNLGGSRAFADIFASLSALVGSLGRFDLSAIFTGLVDQFKPILQQLAGDALGSILGGLQGILGGSRIDIHALLAPFLQSTLAALNGIKDHLINQGLAAVLGGLGGLGGRGLFDGIWETLQGHINTAVTAAQGALGGALGNLSALGSTLLDASKPHLEQLQEQLVGHGLNVLGSLSETINNLHGSITGGR